MSDILPESVKKESDFGEKTEENDDENEEEKLIIDEGTIRRYDEPIVYQKRIKTWNRKCFVDGCSVHDGLKKSDGTDYEFFHFPYHLPWLYRWIELCKPGYIQHNAKMCTNTLISRVICEQHFTPQTLNILRENDQQNDYTQIVYPSLQLPTPDKIKLLPHNTHSKSNMPQNLLEVEKSDEIFISTSTDNLDLKEPEFLAHLENKLQHKNESSVDVDQDESVEMDPDLAVRNFLQQHDPSVPPALTKITAAGQTVDDSMRISMVPAKKGNQVLICASNNVGRCCESDIVEVKEHIDRLGRKCETLYCLIENMMLYGQLKKQSSYALNELPFQNALDLPESNSEMSTPDSFPIENESPPQLNEEQSKDEVNNDNLDESFGDPLAQVSQMFSLANEEKPEWFSCDLCGKAFNKKRYMKTHRKLAHGLAAEPEPGEDGSKVINKCGYCSRKFDTNEDLQKHKIEEHIHVRYECHLCPSSFGRKIKLKYHIRDKHGLELPHFAQELQGIHMQPTKSYKCGICDREFSLYSTLYRHKKIHTRKYNCQKCNMEFENKEEKTRHVAIDHKRKKTYKCRYCLINCETKRELNTHLFLCPQKPQMNFGEPLAKSCPTCGQTFSAISHLLSHVTYCRKRDQSAMTPYPITSSHSYDDQLPRTSVTKKNGYTSIDVARHLLLVPGRIVTKANLGRKYKINSSQVNDAFDLLVRDGLLCEPVFRDIGFFSGRLYAKVCPTDIQAIELHPYDVSIDDYANSYFAKLDDLMPELIIHQKIGLPEEETRETQYKRWTEMNGNDN